MEAPNRPNENVAPPKVQFKRVIPEARNDRISHAVLFDVLIRQTKPQKLGLIIFEGLHGEGMAKKNKMYLRKFQKELAKQLKGAPEDEKQQILLQYTESILLKASKDPACAVSLGKTILFASNIPKPLKDNFSRTTGFLGSIRISFANIIMSGTSNAFFLVLSIVVGVLGGITLQRETATAVQKLLTLTIEDVHNELRADKPSSSSIPQAERQLNEDSLTKLNERFRDILLASLNDLAEQKRRENKKEEVHASFDSNWNEENRKRKLIIETNFVIREAVILLMAENNEEVLRTLGIIAERLMQFNYLNTTFNTKIGVLDIMQIANSDGFVLVS